MKFDSLFKTITVALISRRVLLLISEEVRPEANKEVKSAEETCRALFKDITLTLQEALRMKDLVSRWLTQKLNLQAQM